MLKRLLRFMTILMTFSAIWHCAEALDAQRQLKESLLAIQTYKANFDQAVFNAHGQMIKHYQGTMALQRPNQFRWNTTTPISQLIVADGRFLWIFDQDLQQVSKQPLSHKTMTPAMIISGTAKGLLNDFYISYTQGWYILTPKVMTLVKSVKLYFQQGILTDMEFQDSLNQVSRIHFSHIVQNKAMARSTFVFSPPKGVDVIELQK